MIVFFISSLSVNIFTQIYWSGLINESKKSLEIKIYMLFNLAFANITVSSFFFHFFFIMDLYFWNPAVIAEISNPTTEFTMSIGIQTKETKTVINKSIYK